MFSLFNKLEKFLAKFPDTLKARVPGRHKGAEAAKGRTAMPIKFGNRIRMQDNT